MNELAEIVSRNEEKIRAEWIRDMGKSVQRTDLIGKAELEEQCRALLSAVVTGVRISGPTDISGRGMERGTRVYCRTFQPRGLARDSLPLTWRPLSCR